MKKNYADIARFNRFLKLFTFVTGINSVLWFTVYTGLLASIPLFQAVIANMNLTYYAFWNSIVVLFAVGSYIWLIVEA